MLVPKWHSHSTLFMTERRWQKQHQGRRWESEGEETQQRHLDVIDMAHEPTTFMFTCTRPAEIDVSAFRPGREGTQGGLLSVKGCWAKGVIFFCGLADKLSML